MKRTNLLILLFTMLALIACQTKVHAATTTLPTLGAGSAVSKPDLFITRQGSDTVDKKITGTQLLAFVSSNAAGLAANACSWFTDATTCARALGYADPRQFGATCGSSFNTNNSTANDAPGINTALATNVPVMIPYPGCKAATQIQFTNDGQSIFSFAGAGEYNSNYPKTPYIFVPNDIYTGTTNNCVIDTKGYDGVALRNITIRGNYYLVGTVGVCNSVGIKSGRGAAFLDIDGLSVLNMGNGIGAAMESYFDEDPDLGAATTCQPTGTLMNPVFQVRGQKLNFIGNCMGMYGNFSDMHLTDIYGANITHNVISSTSIYGSAWDISNVRLEYSGRGNPVGSNLFQDGTGFFMGGPYGYNITNLTCDHMYGPCLTAGPNSKNLHWNNINSIDAQYTNDADVVNKCHYALNGVKGLSATNMGAFKSTVNTPYVLCDQGATTANTYVTWNGTSGESGGPGGYSSAYSSLTYGTAITPFDFNVPGIGKYSLGSSNVIGGITPTTGAALTVTGKLALGTAGNGLLIKEGSNATMGTATLSGGTIVVNTTAVTASSRIYLTTNGGTLTNVGTPYISARSAGTSFTITSTNASDAANVAWVIVEPAP